MNLPNYCLAMLLFVNQVTSNLPHNPPPTPPPVPLSPHPTHSAPIHIQPANPPMNPPPMNPPPANSPPANSSDQVGFFTHLKHAGSALVRYKNNLANKLKDEAKGVVHKLGDLLDVSNQKPNATALYWEIKAMVCSKSVQEGKHCPVSNQEIINRVRRIMYLYHCNQNPDACLMREAFIMGQMSRMSTTHSPNMPAGQMIQYFTHGPQMQQRNIQEPTIDPMETLPLFRQADLDSIEIPSELFSQHP